MKQLWRAVLAGDKIRVKGHADLPDGIYEVAYTDADLDRGSSAAGIYTRDHDGHYISNGKVEAIVERGGQPYTGGEEIPAYLRAKLGDMVTVQGSPRVTDGDYEVTAIDDEDGDRLQVAGPGQTSWIDNDHIVAVVTSDAERAWRNVQHGDIVRIKQSNGTVAGDYEVADTDAAFEGGPKALGIMLRGVRWIQNGSVVGIVERGGKPYSGPGAVPGTLPAVIPHTPPLTAARGEFMIHVDVPAIMANKAEGTHKPVIAVRRLRKVDEPMIARELAWDGPTRFVHHEFMRIEGTDVQNWIETDAPLTRWMDGQPLEVLTYQAQPPVPMLKPILGAFVIHVAAPVLMRNRREGRNDPVIAIRRAHDDWANSVLFCRKVEWTGPTRMVHRPTTPIPGTEGRGVCFIETDAPLLVTVDGGEFVEQPPARVLSLPALAA